MERKPEPWNESETSQEGGFVPPSGGFKPEASETGAATLKSEAIHGGMTLKVGVGPAARDARRRYSLSS